MLVEFWIVFIIVQLEKLRAFDPRVGWLLALGAMVLHLGVALVLRNSGWIGAGGALVIILGVLTIARPLIRRGDETVIRAKGAVAKQVREVEGRVVDADPVEASQQQLDVRAELQHGPTLVIVGTAINGYGSLIAGNFFGW
ncbi:hypothetical protein [Allorhizobium ampelinum]|uniref:hypothetical protein n=1 Tax=Allorhizobium ampelinum TaxID=3025782 RepID=UPI0005A1715F|nr:hypothetical protein [Allorhizobium ampelinum]